MPNFSKSFNLKEHIYLAKFVAKQLGITDFKNIQDFCEVQEGIHSDGYSYMFHQLLARPGKLVRESDLRTYDNNIQEYISHINRYRKTKITLKYFQYLAILFTECARTAHQH